MNNRRGVVMLAVLLVACGGKNEQTPASADGGAGPDVTLPSGSAGEESTGGQPGLPSTSPRAQGAVVFTVAAVSPAPLGKACPSGPSYTAAVPGDKVNELDADTYSSHVVDGEGAAQVSCRVAADGAGFVFEGKLLNGGTGLQITGGSISDGTGSAKIIIFDNTHLSSPLSSPVPCAIEVGGEPPSSLQVKAGSMWAHFACTSVESPPSDSCKAEGFFVLENCEQD
jgi:hypothetical protein